MEYHGEERRINVPQLTEEQIEPIAERAAEKAIETVYLSVGRSVVNKVLYLIGAGALALAVWLNGKGVFN